MIPGHIHLLGLQTTTATLAYAQHPPTWSASGDLLDCLSGLERQRFGEIRNPQFAMSWLLGRLLAKAVIRKIHSYTSLAWHEIAIHSRDHRGAGDRPTAWHKDELLPLSLTLSHFDRSVLVAVAADARVRLGVDLVSRDAVRPSVQRTWFTDREQRLARRAPGAAAQIWAAKEAAYKALQRGEPFYPLRIEVAPASSRSCDCCYATAMQTQHVRVTTWTTPCGQAAAFAMVMSERSAS